MIKISKEEAQYLSANGRGIDIHISSITKKSRGKRYYATQSHSTMKLLNDYRHKATMESYEG